MFFPPGGVLRLKLIEDCVIGLFFFHWRGPRHHFVGLHREQFERRDECGHFAACEVAAEDPGRGVGDEEHESVHEEWELIHRDNVVEAGFDGIVEVWVEIWGFDFMLFGAEEILHCYI